jgi:hypothetical protein
VGGELIVKPLRAADRVHGKESANGTCSISIYRLYAIDAYTPQA